MSKVENIEREIQGLSAAELSAFRRWFVKFDAKVWERQIEEDARAGKLDVLAAAALEDHKSGKASTLRAMRGFLKGIDTTVERDR